MGKTIEVEARVGVTKNLGNYESARLDYSARMVIGEDESPKEMLRVLREQLQDMVVKDVGKVTG